MAQPNSREVREALTAFRKRRGILSSAYKAFKREGRARARNGRGGSRGDSLLKAAGVVDIGEREGINVGGIQQSQEIRDKVRAQVHQTTENAAALQERLATPPPSLVSPAPVVGREEFSGDEDDHQAYDDSGWAYLQNRALFPHY